MKLNKLVAGAFLAGSMLAANAHALLVTLNPSAPNAGAVGGSALGPNGAFVTDKGTTDFASALQISGAPNTAGPHAFAETGFLRVVEWAGVTNTVSGVTLDYNVYALFSISGFGAWVAPGTFVGDPLGLTVTATIYGSPGSAALGLTTPTPGTFGITPGAGDFILGTGTLLQGLSAQANLFGNGSALATFAALLSFTPAIGTDGAGGFWDKPRPFRVNIDTSGIGLNQFTTWVTDGVNTTITTAVTPQLAGGGSGNIGFLQVPEPGSVALLGAVLVAGAGVARVRARSKV